MGSGLDLQTLSLKCCFTIVMLCSLQKDYTFLQFCNGYRSVAVRALETFVAGSGFKTLWCHYFFYEIVSLT